MSVVVCFSLGVVGLVKEDSHAFILENAQILKVKIANKIYLNLVRFFNIQP